MSSYLLQLSSFQFLISALVLLLELITGLGCSTGVQVVQAETGAAVVDKGLTSHDHDHIHGHSHAIYKRQIIYARDSSYEDNGSDSEDASSLDQHYREKLKERARSLGSERSYNEIMRELRKDQILREHEQDDDSQKTWEDSSNTLQADDDDYYDSQNRNSRKGKSPKDKSPSNFWTYLLGGAIVVIITLVAIIISLAVHNRRAMQAQTYRAPNLEAPKIVVEENIYTTAPPKPAPGQNSPRPAAETNRDADAGGDGDTDTPASEALLPPTEPTSGLVNPNPIRQPMAPFTYSPIPVRVQDTSSTGG